MKITRQKKAGKVLKFYANNYGFRKPYQVLIDGTFCNAALENKINISDQLTKYLDGEIKIVTTPCAIMEIEKLGSALYGPMLILKQFPFHQCDHKTAIQASACIKSMIGRNNKNRYLVATQDRDLQRHARRLPGVPLLFIHKNAPLLDTPNQSSLLKATHKLNKCCNPTQSEKKVLRLMKEDMNIPQNTFKENPRRKRKGPKGPNPLSCLKKKNKLNPVPSKKSHTNNE